MVAIIGSEVFARTGVGTEIEDVFAEAIEIGRGEMAGPLAAEAMILVRSDVELAGVLGAWMPIPHGFVEFRPIELVADGLEAAGKFCDELADLSAIGRGIGSEEVEEFACASLVFDF